MKDWSTVRDDPYIVFIPLISVSISGVVVVDDQVKLSTPFPLIKIKFGSVWYGHF